MPASAGVALAYVFADIFPHLAKVQKQLGDVETGGLYGFLAHNVYLVALAGFCLNPGIVLLSIAYRQSHVASVLTYRLSPTIVKTETISLALYNFLIGYILSKQITHPPEPVILFAVAMTIHFMDHRGHGSPGSGSPGSDSIDFGSPGSDSMDHRGRITGVMITGVRLDRFDPSGALDPFFFIFSYSSLKIRSG